MMAAAVGTSLNLERQTLHKLVIMAGSCYYTYIRMPNDNKFRLCNKTSVASRGQIRSHKNLARFFRTDGSLTLQEIAKNQ